MTSQNFNTFAKVDPNGHITIASATHIDHLAMRNESAYVYKNFGVNFFGDFTHIIDVNLVSAINDEARGVVWCVADEIGNFYGFIAGLDTAVGVYTWCVDVGTEDGRVVLMEITGGASFTDATAAYAISWNTMYYYVLKKAGTSMTCSIYTDAARTNLVDTLTIPGGLQSDHKFQYLYPCSTYNSGHALALDNDIENLDIQTVPFAGLQLIRTHNL